MTTLTVAFDHNIPMSLMSAIPRELFCYCRSMRLTKDVDTYRLTDEWEPDNFYETLKLVAREHGCAVCYSETQARYSFTKLKFMERSQTRIIGAQLESAR